MDKEAGRQNLWQMLAHPHSVSAETLRTAFIRHLEYSLGKYTHDTRGPDVYWALALALRDMLIDRWNTVDAVRRKSASKRLYYISIEFLLGNLLSAQLINLGLRDTAREVLAGFGFSLDEVAAYEPDAGLGNGGLGRLAACFIDSMACLGLPASGSSLRYEFGMFRQLIINGDQKEGPDNWLARGYPWELTRADRRFPVHFGGFTTKTASGQTIWDSEETVFAVAHDVLIAGYGNGSVNNLRLWRAGAFNEFNLDYFNHGDYLRALQDTLYSENLTRILYPSENVQQGRELRLKQEYFLVSATVQDALKTLTDGGGDIRKLPERVMFHLNDTHPALVVIELLRILVDVYGMDFGAAWQLTVPSIAFTNHTLLPEANETWETDLLERILPRHLELLYELNERFLDEMRSRGTDPASISALSLFQESSPQRVRMVNVAAVGSCRINGVSAMHSRLLRERNLREFATVYPERFHNKTNGIAHRRWLLSANPLLSALISEAIGDGWQHEIERLDDLERFATDKSFQERWRAASAANKQRLAALIRFECGIAVGPEALFEVQVKRIHEYKRQLLALLRLIADYLDIQDGVPSGGPPRVFIFSGKAAPGYARAKLIIRCIHALANLINRDPRTKDRLSVVFLPDFRVSLAELIYPAADLSVQISTAGMEASGTGNMKFMMNGALTVGTLDGANVEIAEAVGPDNAYIFGKTVEELEVLRPNYLPVQIYENDHRIKRVLDALGGGLGLDPTTAGFGDLVRGLTGEGDPYFHLADFHGYCDVSRRIGHDFTEREHWTRRSIINTARSARFSSDRTIRQYATDTWQIEPCLPE